MSPKIKVLAIIYSLEGGGAERQFIHILKHLDRDRFDLEVCLLKATGAFIKHIPPDLKVYNLGKTGILSYIKTIYRLKKIVASTTPEIIYSRMWDANVVTILSKLFLKGVKPKVIINEEIPLSQNFKDTNFGKLRFFITKLIYPHADIIVSISSEVTDDLINRFNLPAEKISYIPNMVDIGSVCSNSSNLDTLQPDNNIFTIISMGGLRIQKGYSDLIRAIKIVNQKFPCQLQILGTGTEETKLKKLAEELGISDKINFLGFLENPFEFIAKADVFAMASLYEGMPCVLLEAMALGMPTIFTDVSGVRDVADDGREIIIVPIASPEIMADKIIFLKENPDYSKMLSENAQKRAVAFSTDAIIKKFESLFILTAEEKN